MKQLRIADTTLCLGERKFSFREKLEIARLLERLAVDVIELPEVSDPKTDVLLCRTVSSFVKNSVISVAAGSDRTSIANAAQALSRAEKPCIRVELPVSPVGMEYQSHKKPPKMLEWIAEAVKLAKASMPERPDAPAMEFCAVDATRAEEEFLASAIAAAVEAGADTVTVCDSAAVLLPDGFAAFAAKAAAQAGVPLGVYCSDRVGLAAASAVLAAKDSAACVKTAVGGQTVPLDVLASVLKDLGAGYGLSSAIRYTELNRILRQISWIAGERKEADAEQRKDTAPGDALAEETILLDGEDDRQTVKNAVQKLGYDLSDEDTERVYAEFLRVAEKKKVGAKELEAVVASAALQVPATFTLKSYIVNNGNIITSSAQITLTRDGKDVQGLCFGEGPVDAAFRALEQIIGTHYELDDFQIQAVTEGKEAVGSALVRLRANGKLYSGNGVSTDIIGASIRAYVAAVNKIVYEETGV